MWYKWALIAIGIGVISDGIGSILIRDGQYHNVWFDGERYVRIAAGVAIIILSIFTP